jgi:hypothetical protein
MRGRIGAEAWAFGRRTLAPFVDFTNDAMISFMPAVASFLIIRFLVSLPVASLKLEELDGGTLSKMEIAL